MPLTINKSGGSRSPFSLQHQDIATGRAAGKLTLRHSRLLLCLRVSGVGTWAETAVLQAWAPQRTSKQADEEIVAWQQRLRLTKTERDGPGRG